MSFRNIVIVGLIIRLAIAPFFSHPFDVFSWYVWSERILGNAQVAYSFLAPYGYSYFLFAVPAAIVFNSLSLVMPNFLIESSSLNPLLIPFAPIPITVIPGVLFDFLVKTPLIASDALIAILIRKLVLAETSKESSANSAAALWFLNPLAIWVSSGWGTFDTIPALLTVLSLNFAINQRQELAGISLAGAIAMKFYALVLVVPLMIYIWKRNGQRKGLSCAGATIATLALLFSPNLLKSGQAFAVAGLQVLPSGPHFSGLSLWSAITLFVPTPSQAMVSTLITFTTLTVFYVWLARRAWGQQSTVLFAASTISILLLLLTYSFVGENFFVWVLPGLAILSTLGFVSKRLFFFLSLLGFVSSVTDTLVPYYMLPVAPWVGEFLMNLLSIEGPYRVQSAGVVISGIGPSKVLLSAYGIAMAIAVIAVIRQIISRLKTADKPRFDESVTLERKNSLQL